MNISSEKRLLQWLVKVAIRSSQTSLASLPIATYSKGYLIFLLPMLWKWCGVRIAFIITRKLGMDSENVANAHLCRTRTISVHTEKGKTMREKLMNLLCDALEDGCVGHCNFPHCFKVSNTADHLIANGVTIATDNNVGHKHGKWLPQMLLGQRVWDCSECKSLGSPQWKVCPVCLAVMDGKKDN